MAFSSGANRQKLVLASESPFRKRALDLIGLKYEVCPSRRRVVLFLREQGVEV